MKNTELKIISKGYVFYVNIGGDLNFDSEFERDNDYTQVTDNIRLKVDRFQFKIEGLLSNLSEGLRWIEPLLLKNIKSEVRIRIHIKTLDVIFVDFYPSLLKIAIAKWLSENLDFELPDWDYELDGKELVVSLLDY